MEAAKRGHHHLAHVGTRLLPPRLEAHRSWDQEKGHPPCGVRFLDSTIVLFYLLIPRANQRMLYSSFSG